MNTDKIAGASRYNDEDFGQLLALAKDGNTSAFQAVIEILGHATASYISWCVRIGVIERSTLEREMRSYIAWLGNKLEAVIKCNEDRHTKAGLRQRIRWFVLDEHKKWKRRQDRLVPLDPDTLSLPASINPQENFSSGRLTVVIDALDTELKNCLDTKGRSKTSRYNFLMLWCFAGTNKDLAKILGLDESTVSERSRPILQKVKEVCEAVARYLDANSAQRASALWPLARGTIAILEQSTTEFGSGGAGLVAKALVQLQARYSRDPNFPADPTFEPI